MVANISKSSVTVANINKSSGPQMIWDVATMIWNEILGTWDDPMQVIANIAKSSVTITNIAKS